MPTIIPLTVRHGPTHVHPFDIVKNITYRDIAGTNVVFINMPLREGGVPNTSPEGPIDMATNLLQNYGVNVTIIDLNKYRIIDEESKRRGLPNGRLKNEREAFELISKHFKVKGQPHLVGLSGMITTLRWQKKVAQMVKTIAPEALLVSGGGLATELRPTALNPLGLFHTLFLPEIDALAHSEGDDVILKITRDAKIIKERGWRKAVESGELRPYLYDEIDGRPRLVYAGDRPRDLDSYPWGDLSLIEEDVNGYKMLKEYLNTAAWGDPRTANSSAANFVMAPKTTSVSSRGCPYSCKYCYRGTQGETRWGIRSAKHLADEMREHIERYGIRFKSFPDDNFAVRIERIQEMVPIFREFKEMGIHWGTHTRLDEAGGFIPKPGSNGKEFIFENPLRVQLMAEAGCKYIGFGPESAHPDTLEALGKGGFTLKAGMTPVSVGGEIEWFPKVMVEGIRHAMIFGIHSNCTWIKGSPTETLENLKTTVKFMRFQEELYADYGVPASAVNKKMFTLTWYPGTKMINHPKVRQELSNVFGITFVKTHPTREEYEPIFDENFRNYVLQLDDAVKVLHDPRTGRPLNFSDMSDDTFEEVNKYVESDQTFKILDMHGV